MLSQNLTKGFHATYPTVRQKHQSDGPVFMDLPETKAQ